MTILLPRGIKVLSCSQFSKLISKNAIIAIPLKYQSNFWRSLKIKFINCKIELKLGSTKHWVLSVLRIANAENVNSANSNNIILAMKETKLYYYMFLPKLYVTLSAKDNQNHQRVVIKSLKDHCIGMNIQQKLRIKIEQMSKDTFLNQNL